jgi:hypothetical protein
VRSDEAARTRADIVFVWLHDGVEYTRKVARETLTFTRAATPRPGSKPMNASLS